MITTYLKSSLATSGGYTLSRPVPKLGWQHKANGGCYVIAITHPETVSSAQAKRAAEAAAIIIPGSLSSNVTEESWSFDYADLAPGKIINRGRGRPPREDQSATSHIHLRVTPERKAGYVQAAQAGGESLSDWMTRTCDAAADGPAAP